MAATRSGRFATVVVAAILVAGCGGSGAGAGGSAQTSPRPSATGPPGSGSPPRGSRSQAIPTPGPTGAPADPAAVKVIRAWSGALRHGDVRAAARYFALPSEMVNGADAKGNPAVIPIHTQAEAVLADATLPCGAQFISADQRGRYVNALFRLTDRPGPGGSCGPGTGQTARTNFVIVDGRIVEWIRAPDDPRDNGGPRSPGPAVPGPPTAPGPAAPPTPQSSGPTV